MEDKLETLIKINFDAAKLDEIKCEDILPFFENSGIEEADRLSRCFIEHKNSMKY